MLSLLVVTFGLTLSAQSISSPDSNPERAADFKYSNLYQKDPKKGAITAYVSGEKEYSQEELDRLMQYDAVLISIDSFMSQSKDKIKTSITPFRLLNAREKTRIGITFDLHAPKNIQKVEGLNATAATAIDIAKDYSFIDELNIVLNIESIEASPDQYQQFFSKLREDLKKASSHGESSSHAEISLTLAMPKNDPEARALQRLIIQDDTSEEPMTKVYLNPRQFDQPQSTRLHHASLSTSQDLHWSTSESIQSLYDLGFKGQQLQLGFSRHAYLHPPLLDDDEPSNPGAAANKQNIDHEVTRDLYTKILDVKQIEGLRANEKSDYKLITDTEFDVDYLHYTKKDHYLAIETPRTVFQKAQYAKNRELGGLFVQDIDYDNQLLLNAAREGLGYNTKRYFFAMKHVINGCGYSDEPKLCNSLHIGPHSVAITEPKTAEQFLDDLATLPQVIHFDNVMTAKYLYAGFKGGIPTTGEEMGITVALKAFYNTEFTTEQYHKIRELYKYAEYYSEDRKLRNYVASHNTEELSASTFKGLYDIATYNRAVSDVVKESDKPSKPSKGKKNTLENSQFRLLKTKLNNPDDAERQKFLKSKEGKKFQKRFDELNN
ncbi:glycoside hydrolase family 18 protein [Vibrio pectenicida]|nr:glycosyl hydrolase family 18 protein [Vibrio pectenicida]